MAGSKKWLRNVFGFSRTESNAFIILLPVIFLSLFSEPFTRWYASERDDDFSIERAKLDSITSTLLGASESSKPSRQTHKESVRLIPFDPNKTSADELHRLGFSMKVATRINNYCKHGGTFRIKSDLKKIYGMDSTLYRNLYTYILLPEVLDVRKETNARADNNSTFEKRLSVLKFDLNTADTTQLKSIRGIGITLANRIIKYRNSLGGFISRSQISEVYGLDTVVIGQLLKVGYLKEGFEPVKININTASQDELEAHPYIKRAAAKAIVMYRFQHGNFTQLEELKSVHQLKNVDKIIPYIDVE